MWRTATKPSLDLHRQTKRSDRDGDRKAESKQRFGGGGVLDVETLRMVRM